MAFNSVILKRYSNIQEEYVAAAATIYPGCLIEYNSSGEVQVHSTPGGDVLPMFAIEDALQGNGINTNYSTGDRVRCWVATRGEIVYAILADGEDVHKGDFLESNGAGYLRKYNVLHASSDPGVETRHLYAQPIVGQALEDVDASADSSGVDFLSVNKRIKVRIL